MGVLALVSSGLLAQLVLVQWVRGPATLVASSALVTADHGNADQMIADDGVTPFTQHTTNPVPVILVSEEYKSVKLPCSRSLYLWIT